MANIPGAAAVHKIISKDCRTRPQEDVLEDVLSEVKEKIIELDGKWSKDSDVKFHVVVLVERPK